MKTVDEAPPDEVRRDLFKALGIVGIFDQKWKHLVDIRPTTHHWPCYFRILCDCGKCKSACPWPPKFGEFFQCTQVDLRAMRMAYPRFHCYFDFFIGMCPNCDAVFWTSQRGPSL